MKTHADQTHENESREAVNIVSQRKSGGEADFQFEDKRPEAIQTRRLQEVAGNNAKNNIYGFEDDRPGAVAQRKMLKMINSSSRNQPTAQFQKMGNEDAAVQKMPLQRKANNTGLPDQLKSGIENLSGYSMDDVKVYYNSKKPAQLQAHAYAQGTDIYVASGQEKHLPHEAWHVVQQKQGRVKPTLQMKGKVNINDDQGLEKEADIMGLKALQMKPLANGNVSGDDFENSKPSSTETAQLALNDVLSQGNLNVVGEIHGTIPDDVQKAYMKQLGIPAENLWHEYDFKYLYQYNQQEAKEVSGDSKIYLVQASHSIAHGWIKFLVADIISTLVNVRDLTGELDEEQKRQKAMNIFSSLADDELGIPGLMDLIETEINQIEVNLAEIPAVEGEMTQHTATQAQLDVMQANFDIVKAQFDIANDLKNEVIPTDQKLTMRQLTFDQATVTQLQQDLKDLLVEVKNLFDEIETAKSAIDTLLDQRLTGELWDAGNGKDYTLARSYHMHMAAYHKYNEAGVWKIGQQHVNDIIANAPGQEIRYNLVPKDAYSRLLLRSGLLPTSIPKTQLVDHTASEPVD